MRVLLLVHGVPPAAAGGTELYGAALARALGACGDEVTVFARSSDPGRPELSIERDSRPGFSLVTVNHTFRAARRFADTWRHPGIARILDDVLARWPAEIAHVQHLTGLGIDVLDVLRERGIPIVWTLADYWPICHRGQLLDRALVRCEGPLPSGCPGCPGAEAAGVPAALAACARALPGPLHRPLLALGRHLSARPATARRATLERARDLQRALAGADLLLAPSPTLRARYLAFGVDPARIEPTEQGIDLTPFTGVARTPSDRLRVGFLGSLMVSKAPHLLLEAAARLRPGTVEVHVFGSHADYHGDASYRHRLEPRLAAAGVRWHGPLPHERIGEAFAAIDVLVVPSIWIENAPFVIREAFAAGVPVVAADLGGMADSVRDGVDGLLFRPGDPADLAAALLRLAAEPGLLARLRAGIRPPRSIEQDAAALRARYRALLASRRPAGRALRIAAVLVDHDTPEETRLALRSLGASTRRPDWTIVVDSSEGNPALAAAVAAEPGTSLFAPGRNLGFPGSANLGIRRALELGADAVLVMNPDVWLAPSALARLAGALAADPGLGIVGPLLLCRDDPRRIASAGLRFSVRTGRMKHAAHRAPVAGFDATRAPRPAALEGSVLLLSRHLLVRTGGFDPDYFFSFEDLDLGLRAVACGFGLGLVPSARALHRGGASLAPFDPRRIYFATRNHLRCARRCAPLGPLASAARTAAIAALNLAHALFTARAPRRAAVRAWLRGLRDSR